MKRYFVIFSLTILAVVSCAKTSTEYSVRGTDIKITPIPKYISASYAKVRVELGNDKNYYYCGILPETVYQPKSDNSRFMQLMLDSNYKEYINWRYDLLQKDEKYIASFASHCLRYGNNEWHFSKLMPDTRYMVYAFCVNPDILKPTGELYYAHFTTRMVEKSSMTFKFAQAMQGTDAHVTVMPSNDDERYVWRVVSQKELDMDYKGDLYELVYTEVALYEDYQMIDQVCCKGFHDRNYGSVFFKEGEAYIVYAVGYDGDINTEIYSTKFYYPFDTLK